MTNWLRGKINALRGVVQVLIGVAGAVLLGWADWRVLVGVLLLLWSNNLEHSYKVLRDRYSE